jgi:PAS domain S-box-containing protein
MMELATVAGRHRQEDRREEEDSFCSYCGRLGAGARRVCASCGLGVLLHTSPGVLDSPGAAFLIVDVEGSVSAVSAAAERIVGRQEDLIGRPLPSVLVAEDGSPTLEVAVTRAATGIGSPETVPVVQVQEGQRVPGLEATVATCAEPRAALLVLRAAHLGDG